MHLIKFLPSSLQPLTPNNYSVKDIFDIVCEKESLPPTLFNEGYRYDLFDIESLFTNANLLMSINLHRHARSMTMYRRGHLLVHYWLALF